MRNRRGRSLAAGFAVATMLAGAGPALAQQQEVTVAHGASAATAARELSLEAALRLAEDNSEQVQIAEAAVMRAKGQELQARSQMLPQVFGSLGYTRTLASEFSALSSAPDTTQGPPPPENCGSFNPNPGLPLDQRVDSLEHALECAQSSNPFSGFANKLPFGRKNQLQLGLSVQQNLFTGGRIRAQNRAAEAGRQSAEVALRSTRAQLVLDVTQAYYDAALADRLVSIAEATLAQSERQLAQTRLARQVGDQPEFELLRAQVAYENQKPVVIQRRSDRNVAYMRLKQLLDIPLAQDVSLTTSLGDSVAAVPIPRLAVNASTPEGDTAVAVRAPVLQAAAAVTAEEAQARVASAQRLPSLSLVSSYGRVAYPETFAVPDWNDFRSNWTVGVSLSVPLFTGGRIKGDELVAKAGVLEARARLEQTRELAALDARTALDKLEAAKAAFQASAGTAQQASRAYQIAEVRYREGISTQLELTDSRVLMQQAEANRAVAARDLQIAMTRVALLPDLPLGSAGSATSGGGGTQGGGATGSPAQPQTQQQPAPQAQPQTQPRVTTTAASPAGGSTN